MKQKKRGSGGAKLLEKHGPDYFRKLAIKGVKQRQKALKLWKKTQKTSNAKSVTIQD
jgi:hypothetical protein